MVDRIGTFSVTPPETRNAAIGAPSAAAAVAKSRQTAGDGNRQQAAAQSNASGSLRSLARELATKPPVDAARVTQIKRAIAEGRYPIEPETIADRMLALRLNWNPNEQA